MTMRSMLLGRIALDANSAIVQEIHEFRTFAKEGRNPLTAQPFATLEGLMDLYLLRQTPDRGEAFIGVTPNEVLYVNNAMQRAGEALAQDSDRLAALVNSPENSGVEQTAHGEMRWGKAQVIAEDGQTGTFVVTYFTRSQSQVVAQETLMHFGVALGGLLLIGLLTWSVAGQVLRPIGAIKSAARRVDGHGPVPRVPIEGNDELAELARSFNTMASRVDQAHSAQQHFIEQVRRHFNQGGSRARAHLARLETAAGDAATQAAESRALQALLARTGQTLADLDLLLRATQPDFLQPAAVDLARLGDDVMAQAGALRDVQGQPRHWQLMARAEGSAALDAPRVLDAMRHLLVNAVDHSQPGDTLEVSAERHEENGVPVLRLSVASPGQPLSHEEAQAVFAFSHLLEEESGSAADDDKDASMGVGLAVVRAVAEAHGG
ncbi:MAG: HAMP domain-containing protein, partial [Pseudomonadota bacterium]|nr:HAMP domain-containing protein [Pseudomonadota bacterium]